MITRARVAAGVLGITGLALAWGGAAVAETPGALESRSIHETAEAEAQENVHQPRHGGYFGDADDLYHYEVLLDPSGRLTLYVNDERNAPLDTRGLTGHWTLNPDLPVPQPLTGAFTSSPDGAYFYALLPLSTDEHPVHVAVEVLKGGEWAAMEFYLPRTPSPSASPKPSYHSGAGIAFAPTSSR